jgi:hypothetical protein
MPWAPSYASTDELREFVRIDDDADDTVIEDALAGASRAIDYACDPRPGRMRQFGKVDEVEDRYYTARLRGYGVPVRGQWVCEVDDIASVVGLVVACDPGGTGTYTEVAGTSLLPRNAAALGEPFETVSFYGSALPNPPPWAEAVRVTAWWGWPAVPQAIHEACMLQASRLLSRRDAPFGVAGSPETGTEVRLLARLDPDVEILLKPYVRKIGTVLE